MATCIINFDKNKKEHFLKMVTTNQANLIAELYGEIDMLKSRLKELNSQIMANDKKEPF